MYKEAKISGSQVAAACHVYLSHLQFTAPPAGHCKAGGHTAQEFERPKINSQLEHCKVLALHLLLFPTNDLSIPAGEPRIGSQRPFFPRPCHLIQLIIRDITTVSPKFHHGTLCAFTPNLLLFWLPIGPSSCTVLNLTIVKSCLVGPNVGVSSCISVAASVSRYSSVCLFLLLEDFVFGPLGRKYDSHLTGSGRNCSPDMRNRKLHH